VAVKRRIHKTASGRWVVVAPDSSRYSSVHLNREEAMATAKAIVYHAGGGEIVIEERDGKTETEQVE
jgi:hypothetical protein